MKRIAMFAAVMAMVVLTAPEAMALLTPISSAPSGELSLDTSGGILDMLYGLSNLQRISDSFAGDQLWEVSAPAGRSHRFSPKSRMSIRARLACPPIFQP
jgi:hypothetical protein